MPHFILFQSPLLSSGNINLHNRNHTALCSQHRQASLIGHYLQHAELSTIVVWDGAPAVKNRPWQRFADARANTKHKQY
jgi:hypothetical protein